MTDTEKLSNAFHNISPWVPAFLQWEREYAKIYGEYPPKEERVKKIKELHKTT